MTNENEYVDANGVRYVAKDDGFAFCEDCAFEFSNKDCAKAASCTAMERKDERSIIWIKAE